VGSHYQRLPVAQQSQRRECHHKLPSAHLDEQEVLLDSLLVALVVQACQRLVWMVLQRLLPIGCTQIKLS